MLQLSRRIAPLAVLATALGGAALALAPAARADTTSVTFPSTGSEQTFKVPTAVHSLHVVLVGGRGGNSDGPNGAVAGGFGAVLDGTLTVSPGDILYVEVGGNGHDGDATADAAGGFNGGGTGPEVLGAGGGGASDIRTVSTSDSGSLDSRLIAAGGGGGAGYGTAGGSSSGIGSPGGSPDQDCQVPGHSGGAAGPRTGGNPGSGSTTGADGHIGLPGFGGNGGGGILTTPAAPYGGGGGGGGWFGGGGGGGGGDCAGGGGGGSSGLVETGSAHQNSVATDTTGTPQITISYLVPLPPKATTTPASDVGQSGATLNAVVDPQGFETTYRFQWGTSTNPYGASNGDAIVAATSGPRAVSYGVSGLLPDTTYHFRVIAHNANGDTNGDDLTFRTAPATPPPAPQVTTEPASDIGQSGATLNGVVNPEGTFTGFWFNYGTTADYSSGTIPGSAGSSTFQTAVSAAVTGLSPGTTYHFQLVASGSGTTYGADQTFTTASAPTGPAPTAVTKAASKVGWLKAQLNGSVTPRGSATTYFFEYGTTTRYGASTAHKSAGSGRTAKSVSAALSGLTRHTTYHFRLVAVNASGTTFGVDKTFRTG
jgi:hypothetical protein